MLASDVRPKLFARNAKFTENGVYQPTDNLQPQADGNHARNDGKGYYPFTDDGERFENGVAMTQRNCKRQFEQTLRGIISRIRDRRFVAVDRERGIVVAFAFFDHEQIDWTWRLAERFKIENGLIRGVEAVFHRAPYGTPSGWSTVEQALSESIQGVR
jgi:hypothetical protein